MGFGRYRGLYKASAFNGDLYIVSNIKTQLVFTSSFIQILITTF